jgi:hypothetical protein
MICGLLAESPTPSIRSISKCLGLGYATTWRYVNELKTSIKRGSLTSPRSRATRVRRC